MGSSPAAPASASVSHLIGIPRVEFLALLRRRGVPHVQYSAEDYRGHWEAMESPRQKHLHTSHSPRERMIPFLINTFPRLMPALFPFPCYGWNRGA